MFFAYPHHSAGRSGVDAMSSKAWMPAYIGDYLRDTMHLSTLQHGMYTLLIYHYWEHGGLPDTAAGRSRVARVPDSTWRDHEPTLAAFFSQPGWRHKRIDAELAKYEKVRHARQLAGATGGTKTQASRFLRLASAQAFASKPRVANAQANGVPTTKQESNSSFLTVSETTPRAEEKKRVAEEASKKAVVQGGASLTASPYLAAVLEEKGWVRK